MCVTPSWPVPSPGEKGGGLCVRPAPSPRKNPNLQNQKPQQRYWINGIDPGESAMTWTCPPTKLLSSRTVSRIATWNVRTMYETGRTAQVAREFQRYRLDILGLTEVRWTNSGRVTLATGETLLHLTVGRHSTSQKLSTSDGEQESI